MTKPKVLAHFSSCRTRSVSCIDCGVTFDRKTVRPHTSCITEEAKYGPKSGHKKANSQTFCVDCDLALPGAVAAVQHYESKKHKAVLRRKKAAHKTSGAAGPLPRAVAEKGIGEDADLTVPIARAQSGVGGVPEIRVEDLEASVCKKARGVAVPSIKKAMKRVLRGAKVASLRLDVLQEAVERILGDKSPVNLGDKILKRAQRSPFRTSSERGVVSLLKE
jgi:hypothetical protein